MRFRLITLVCLIVAMPAAADDWPQWRGPKRDGKSTETGFAPWPKEGPKLLWTFNDAGSGYSSFAVVGNVLYSAGGEEGKEDFAFAVDTRTGKQLWRTKIGRWFSNGWGGGPRGTPAIDGDFIYVLSGAGDLVCLKASDGKKQWSKSLTGDLKGKLMSGWGYSESVLVDGDNVICSPGGDDGVLAALDKKTGAVRWRSEGCSDKASYSSIVISEACGVRHYVQLTDSGVVGVAPKDGKVLWRVGGESYRIAVIPTPMVDGDHVFATTDYGAKCMLIRLSKDGDGLKAEKVYSNKSLENHHGGAILHDGHVFASHGNANNKNQLPFVCLNAASGSVIWRETKALEPSSIALAGGEFYCFGQQTGAMVRIAATSKGFEERGRFTIPDESKQRSPQGAIWTHPVIADGKLFLRDQELIFCYSLK